MYDKLMELIDQDARSIEITLSNKQFTLFVKNLDNWTEIVKDEFRCKIDKTIVSFMRDNKKKYSKISCYIKGKLYKSILED